MNMDLPIRPANGRGDTNSSSTSSSGVGSVGDRGRPFFTSPSTIPGGIMGSGNGSGAVGGVLPYRRAAQSEAEAIAGPVREVAPMNDRLIVGVDFGTTYSG